MAERRRIALVTGATRGLGRAIAAAFAREGHDLIIVSRKPDACAQIAAELEREFGIKAAAIACHLGRWDECTRLAGEAWDRFGRIDVLVNNAGMSPAYDDIEALSEDLFDKIMGVNLKGPFRLGALIGLKMQAAGGGVIVNIGSSAASRPLPNAIPYSAAKAGVIAMTKGLAGLLGPTVRVNCVEPAGIETDMSRAIPADVAADYVRDQAIKRFARPEEVAGAVLYLAGEGASFTTGAVLRVDGGLPG